MRRRSPIGGEVDPSTSRAAPATRQRLRLHPARGGRPQRTHPRLSSIAASGTAAAFAPAFGASRDRANQPEDDPSLGMMEPMTPDAGGAPLPSAVYGDFFHAAPVALLVLRAADLVMLEANQPYLDAVGKSLEELAEPLRLRRLPQQPHERRLRPGDRPPLADDGGRDQACADHGQRASATTSPAATASTSGGGTSSRRPSSRTARSPTCCTTPRTSPTCTAPGPSSPRPRRPRRSRPPSWPVSPRWRCPSPAPRPSRTSSASSSPAA